MGSSLRNGRLKSFFGFFRIFSFLSVCFETVCFGLFRFYTETESFDVLIEPKQAEDPPKHFERENIWVIFRKFRVVLVCFGLLRNSSVCYGCFDIGSKNRNKPKIFVLVSQNKPKKLERDLVSV
jgi:hypothetical protein